GRLDVLGANDGPSTSPRGSLLRGVDGGWAPAIALPLNRTSQGVAIGDLDADGDLDAVFTEGGINGEGNSAAVLLNDGTGALIAGGTIASGPGPSGVAIADLDGDGHADLAICNERLASTGTSMTIRWGDGSATFGGTTTLTTLNGPRRVLCGDFDADGRLDLAVATAAPRIQLFRNLGRRAFATPLTLVPSSPSPLTFPFVGFADADGDGDLDLFGGYRGFATGVDLFRNRGDATFDPATPIAFPIAASQASDIALGDVDGDGDPDLVATTQAGDEWLLFRNGAGTFTFDRRLDAGEYPISIEVADTDGDGDSEVVIANRLSLDVTVFENDGMGDFRQPPTVETGGFSTAGLTVAIGDLDGDGDLDAVSSWVGHWIMLNDGTGTLGPGSGFNPGRGAKKAELEDVDGDGNLDLVCIPPDQQPPYHLLVLRGHGDGTFGSIESTPIASCGNSDLVVCDLDLDGDPDVVVAEWLACPGTPFSGRRLFACLNQGDGTFTMLPPAVLQTAGAATLAAGDFDEDGVPDLFLGTQPASVVLGRGDGTFEVDAAILLDATAIDIDLADLDGDGHLDAVGVVPDNGTYLESLAVWMGRGDGGFETVRRWSGASSPMLRGVREVELGDFDGDGLLDAATTDTAANAVSVYRGLGGGWFADESRYGAGDSPIGIDGGDLDGDRVADIAVTITTGPPLGNGVALLRGLAASRCPEDLDRSGIVDAGDLAVILATWGKCRGCASDLDQDGSVNAADLAKVLSAWGCP
ncbi:MAG: FG-GAP-like repeat-containing protein, partial [Phycisphaerales bacterium]